MASDPVKITLVGAGTIGLSFAALHLAKGATCLVTIYDTRPDLQSYVSTHLPSYLLDIDLESCTNRLFYASNVADAVTNADIIQEQGPESAEFKKNLWPEIEKHAPEDALFWSSTSGIPASIQSEHMQDKSRLLVVHPYNPPHIMPLLELVPSPHTSQSVIDKTLDFWRNRGRTPVVIKKECTGFVANRLAFALFREACSLAASGVASVEDIDSIVTSSMGPRWAVAGPFKAYHAGGGEGGLKTFMEKIGGTVGECWNASEEDVRNGNIRVGGDWQADVCRQSDEAYGAADTSERDVKTKKVLEAVRP
ncbi:hypothetical protein DOTSEDRAFT_90013 [Dothistroma septosporum NZE10]|uniref:L-gulonate 3-dehydrogenase n=1 Tax=Dothistroma septosporum (strain NZE10 / CBS 128990) TaxID=675120 RepID=N1PKT2_DOTSN|nr:hypothetical protein DOTSEDRAFT_90013 [Dothistroma septosporum NZE10]